MRAGLASVVVCGSLLVEIACADELPVREVTVFKDGHSLVLREGTREVDEQGDVILTDLPRPVLGTFWPYSADEQAALVAVTAGEREVSEKHEVTSLTDVIDANLGRRMRFARTNSSVVEGVATRLIGQPPMVVLETDEGVHVIPVGTIMEVTLMEPGVESVVSRTMTQAYIEMDLRWDHTPSAAADVGVMYVQKGLRWIPNYRITLDGDGHAVMELQATLVNELIDLDNVTTHLVIGVPQFTFKDTLDPMALQRQIAPLGQYFEVDSRSAGAFSNALLTQARMGERRDYAQSAPPPETGPELSGGERTEDLFMFTVKGVTLGLGERMVIPIKRFELEYEDVYKLDLPIEPPAPFWARFNSHQQREITRLLERPNVRHAIRIRNTTDTPVTTAPALIMVGDRVMAQGMTTYAAPGASVDLEITDAVDVKVEFEERELERELNHKKVNGTHYHLATMESELTLTNHRDVPLRFEVSRFVLGSVDEVSEGVTKTSMSIFSYDAFSDAPDVAAWWRWYDWPWWWMRVNGPQRLEWNVEIEAGESRSMTWRWHYHWV